MGKIIIIVFSFLAVFGWGRYVNSLESIPRKPKEILWFCFNFVVLVILPLTILVISIVEHRHNYPKNVVEWKLDLVYLVMLVMLYIELSFLKPIFWFLLGLQKREKIVQLGLEVLKHNKEKPSRNVRNFLRFLHRYFKVPSSPSEENIEAAIDQWIERLENEQAKINALKDSRFVQNRKVN